MSNYEIEDITEKRDSGIIFEELGIVPDVVEEQNDGVDIPSHFNITDLSDAYDGDYLSGKPFLSDIKEYEFEDRDTGEQKKLTQCVFTLVDYDDEEAYRIRINLKDNNIVQENVHKSSKLYALVVGLINIKNKGAFDNYNHIKRVDLSKIQLAVSEIEDMVIKVVEMQSKNFKYNSFVVVSDE